MLKIILLLFMSREFFACPLVTVMLSSTAMWKLCRWGLLPDLMRHWVSTTPLALPSSPHQGTVGYTTTVCYNYTVCYAAIV